MSKIYSVYKCDCCGALREGDPREGSYLIIEGNPRWPSMAKEKYEFPDICEACRDALRRAIQDALKARGWRPPRCPTPKPAAESDAAE